MIRPHLREVLRQLLGEAYELKATVEKLERNLEKHLNLVDLPELKKVVNKLLQIHPMFWPHTYVKSSVEILDDDRVRFAIRDCPALYEEDGYTWFAQLGDDGDRALDAIVQAVTPQASCHPVAANGDERRAYEAVIDQAAKAAPEAPEIGLAKFSTGASFVFTPRRPVRV